VPHKVGVTFRFQHKLEPYLKALQSAGLEPVPISPANGRSLDGLGGLVLTGGSDISPARYNEQPQAQTQDCDDARDQMEEQLLQHALKRDLPVLAICRGMQLFNVVHGGTLAQHVENHSFKSGGQPVHEVQVIAGTRLASIIGPGNHAVNSRHHQAVAVLGKGLKVSAVSANDNLVEGLERADQRFAVAVQWHPEDQAETEPAQRKLFEAFAEAVWKINPG
jgi:putative glutamine amidotransferase